MNDRYSDKKIDRDDADARGEHLYEGKPAPREESGPDPLERKPGHYAAGANGTHDVSGPPVEGSDSSTANDPPMDDDPGKGPHIDGHENHNDR